MQNYEMQNYEIISGGQLNHAFYVDSHKYDNLHVVFCCSRTSGLPLPGKIFRFSLARSETCL